MNDEKQLAPDTAPDVLSAHVDKHISLPETEKFDNESLIDEVSAHPNLPAPSIQKLYDHGVEHVAQSSLAPGQHEAGNMSNTAIANIMAHPNTPKSIKLDFANKTFHPENTHSDIHEELADSGLVDEPQLRAWADQNLASGHKPHSYKHISPDYYLSKFRARSQQDPKDLPPDDVERHGNEAKFAFQGLLDSAKHTPASLDQTIDAIIANKSYQPHYSLDNHGLLEDLIEDREDLSAEHLSKIHAYNEANKRGSRHYGADLVSKILEHPNVDPSILAKYAVGKDVRSEALSHPNLPKQSIDAAVKRYKNDGDYYSNQRTQALLKNPNITKEHIKELVKKGSKLALHHDLADEADVRDAWNASPKDLDSARSFLSAAKVPPDVLKDLVSHKNQEVAINALNHKNSDMTVVQAGLDRKAKAVQEAARIHPLVAANQVKEGLASGKVSLSRAFDDEDYEKHFNSLPETEQHKIFNTANDKYKGTDLEAIAKATKEKSHEILHSKLELARDPRVPKAVQESNVKDLVRLFKDKVGTNRQLAHATKAHILDESHQGDDSRIVSAIADLAQDGNKEAQAAILKNPAIAHNLHHHMDLKTAPSDFLTDAWEANKTHHAAAATIMDRYGSPQKFDEHGKSADEILSSPMLSGETFQKIASDKDAMERIGESDVFNRYNELPESEQIEKYQQILAAGSPEANKSIVRAKAPAQVWDAAFASLSDADKNDRVGEGIKHIKSHRPDIFHNAVMGTYNTAEAGNTYRRDERTKSQAQALKHLTDDSLQDRASLKQLISVGETAGPGYADDDFIMHNTNKSMYTNSFELADHAMAAGRNSLSQAMVSEKFRKDIDQARISSYDKSPENTAKAQAVVTNMQAKLALMPSMSLQGGDTPNVAQNWYDLIEKSKKTYGGWHGEHGKTYLSTLKAAGANLDFLADLPDENGAGTMLKREALKENLLSDAKLNEIANTGSAKDLASIGDLKERQRKFSEFLNRPNLSPEDLSDIVDGLNVDYMSPQALRSGRRKSMTDDDLEQFNGKLTKLLDLASEKDPSLIPDIVRKSVHVPKGTDALTKADLDSINKTIMNHVQNRQYSSPQEHNATMYQVSKAMGETGRPRTSMRQIEEKVFGDKDYDTMSKMAEEGNLSDSGLAKLSKVISQPGVLSLPQVAAISSNMDYHTDPAAVLGMAKAFEAKLAEAQAVNPNANLKEVKQKFLRNITKTYNPRHEDEADKRKSEFVINYNKKAALDPHTSRNANSNLLNISVTSASQDLDKSLDLYDSLPQSKEAFAIDPSRSLPNNMVNHPRFVESAQSDWRLSMLAANAEQLTGANTSILTDRVLSSAGDHLDRMSLYNKLEANKFASPEDSVKLARSISANDFNKFVKQDSSRWNAMLGNTVFAAHARLQDLQNFVNDPNLVKQGAQHMDNEHRNHVVYNLEALTHAIKNAKFDESLPNVKEKLSKISEMIDTVQKNVQTVADAIGKEIQTKGYSQELGRDHQYLLSIASNIANAGLQLDREDALKAADILGQFDKIWGMEGGPGAGQANTKSAEVIGSLVQRAENFEAQDWKHIFSGAPHAALQLSKRSNIPAEALANIDYKVFENHPQKPGDFSHAQAVFTEESRQWFGKMSKEDLNTHGRNLMDMYMRMQGEGKIQGGLYQKAMLDAMKYTGNILSNSDLQGILQRTKAADIRASIYKTAIENGVGGHDALKSYIREAGEAEIFRDVKEFHGSESGNVAQKLRPILKSPHIDDEIGSKVVDMFGQNPSVMDDSVSEMLDNKSLPSQPINKLAKMLFDNHEAKYEKFDKHLSSDLASKLMQSPNVSEADLGKMFELSNESFPKYFASSGKFNPALTNPTHGGKLFRSMPIVVPKEVPNVDESKVVKSVSLQHKDYKKMQDIMNHIPAEGMSWVDFKRKFPEMEKNIPAAAKAVFMAGNNKPVLPEQFAQAMRSLDDNSKKYHLTYSKWDSPLQRHRGGSQKANLVVQVNNSEESERTLSQDPKLWSLYQKLLQDTNGIDNGSIGLHPTTPHLVSWSRVDTDQGKDSWAIEEYQSDFAQKFRRNVKSLLNRFPSGTKINGQHITAEDMSKYAKVIDKHLDDWAEASMQAVVDNAKAHGIKKLYMHGAELRGNMSNSGQYSREFWDNPNTKPQTVGFRKVYGEMPPKFGFQECDYTDYPTYSEERLDSLRKNKLSTKCWVMNLDEQDKGPKRKKKQA